MTQKDDILQELLELKSKLAFISRQNIFQAPVGYFDGLAGELLKRVRALESDNEIEETGFLSPQLNNLSQQIPYSTPAGYFDNLPEQILKRVKTSEPGNVADELACLSPLLSKISKQVPYTAPVGYFDTLEKKLKQPIINYKDQTAEEEIESISPLLGQLKKQTTYTVPEGYFENLQLPVINESTDTKTKVISITSRKWFRYAAAALVIGFVATMGLLFLTKKDPIDPADKSFAWIQKNMKKVSTAEINQFVELANAGTPDVVKADTKEEINNLLKDVSDKEIQDFLNDTQTAEPDTDDDLILN
ncbi:MAG: hypothetical protein ABI675_18905 [Chitinophagaceae bacterium]